jgi:mono/diheme cytochrome c family protein
MTKNRVSCNSPQSSLLQRIRRAGQAAAVSACAALVILSGSTLAQQKESRANIEATGDVARGKYLVENVAMCGQCHTPRNGNGELDQSRKLQGSSVFLQPPYPDPNWPINAPRIGGNPPASDADMIKLLTTGIWTNGKTLRFPMMPFRMNEADAKAVVAYLKSLQPQQ